MYFVDFVFDGLKLSDFGCMVGSAVTGNNDAVSLGSVLNLETIINHGSYRSEIINVDYPDVYTVTFDIFKKPCGGGYGDSFTDREVTFFMRWLNRKEYCKFIPIYDDEQSFHNTYLLGTFTEIQAVSLGGEVQGFALTFTSNSPFSYMEAPLRAFDLDSTNGNSFTIHDESDELGIVYPSKFEITINSNGDFVLTNSLDDSSRKTSIKNCSSGEVITMDCIHKVITSSNSSHVSLYKDFNYSFPRLKNDLKTNANTFVSNIPCRIALEYNPIRKAGVIA